MTTALQAFNRIQTQAESIRSDEPQKFPEAASVGEGARQGDIYIVLLANIPSNARRMARPNPQLAPGTTRGSRHILDSLEGVEMFTIPNADQLTGPVFRSYRERVVTHPEHGDFILPPRCYSIWFQRQHADTLRRVAD
jgi:hypothetical protein